MTVATRCTAIRKDGRPCAATIVLPSGHCHMHDPDRAGELAAVRAAGGKARSNGERAYKLMPARLKPLFHKLGTLYDEVHDGGIEPDRARACAAIAGVMVRVLQSGELEERLQAVERTAADVEAQRAVGGGRGDGR